MHQVPPPEHLAPDLHVSEHTAGVPHQLKPHRQTVDMHQVDQLVQVGEVPDRTVGSHTGWGI